MTKVTKIFVLYNLLFTYNLYKYIVFISFIEERKWKSLTSGHIN